jgi:hypothetical protein
MITELTPLGAVYGRGVASAFRALDRQVTTAPRVSAR